jgi:hypothetical protein
MSNFIPVENRLGIQPISQTNAALPSQYQVGQSPEFGQAHPLGTIVRAYDTTLGEGEFIYLAGVSATAVGSLVYYNPLAGTSTLTPNTGSTNYPVAVAMSANLKTQYGWYQINGVATILKTAVKISPSSKIWQSATTGRVFSTSTAGKQIFDAISVNAATVASGTSTIQVLIQRPFMEPIAT